MPTAVDPTPTRRILLADADAFYVAVARLVDPEGAGKERLLIVGGSAEQRGVVTSASYETRAYGVHSAMPMARAMRLCPQASVVPVPWEACGEKSREIRHVLQRFCPVVEQASSDEFYADLSGTERLYGGEPLAETARRIRAAVREHTALDVTIGAGTSKLVAKLAAGVAKPTPGGPGSGVLAVPAGGEAAFLARFALADLPGVGPRFQEQLGRHGLGAVPDVLAHDPAALERALGEREARWLRARCQGIDPSPVEPYREAKSISRDETFPEDLDTMDELSRELLALVDRATADLRAEGLVARTVTVRLRDADFRTRQAGRTLPDPVQSDRAVYAVARALLERLRGARPIPARLVGVALSGLVKVGALEQLTLFEPEPGREPVETERDRVVARLIDEVRERFGEKALRRGAAGLR
jgi:DNA polymerase-4